ncbi:MAG: hypothetical protein M1828_002448 [Chrysothrix sp. TS-e1954]|nr:MAG: hypothetical protein M1828_002448 [Chrysothrix sp. TS-e1954]
MRLRRASSLIVLESYTFANHIDHPHIEHPRLRNQDANMSLGQLVQIANRRMTIPKTLSLNDKADQLTSERRVKVNENNNSPDRSSILRLPNEVLERIGEIGSYESVWQLSNCCKLLRKILYNQRILLNEDLLARRYFTGCNSSSVDISEESRLVQEVLAKESLQRVLRTSTRSFKLQNFYDTFDFLPHIIAVRPHILCLSALRSKIIAQHPFMSPTGSARNNGLGGLDPLGTYMITSATLSMTDEEIKNLFEGQSSNRFVDQAYALMGEADDEDPDSPVRFYALTSFALLLRHAEKLRQVTRLPAALQKDWAPPPTALTAPIPVLNRGKVLPVPFDNHYFARVGADFHNPENNLMLIGDDIFQDRPAHMGQNDAFYLGPVAGFGLPAQSDHQELPWGWDEQLDAPYADQIGPLQFGERESKVAKWSFMLWMEDIELEMQTPSYLTSGTWCGYRSESDGKTFAKPMVNLQFTSLDVSSELEPQAQEWADFRFVEATFSDSFGKCRLKGTYTGGHLSVEKTYTIPRKGYGVDGTDVVYWSGNMTAWGIIGNWGTRDRARRETVRGIFWIWKKEWTAQWPRHVCFSPETLSKRLSEGPGEKKMTSEDRQLLMERVDGVW